MVQRLPRYNINNLIRYIGMLENKTRQILEAIIKQIEMIQMKKDYQIC